MNFYPKRTRLFVYGTLKWGHGLHRCMGGAIFLGRVAVHDFTLYVDGVPLMVPQPGGRVLGELYDVPTWEVKTYLDLIEHAYDREEIQTTGGPAQAYVYHGPLDGSTHLGEEF